MPYHLALPRVRLPSQSAAGQYSDPMTLLVGGIETDTRQMRKIEGQSIPTHTKREWKDSGIETKTNESGRVGDIERVKFAIHIFDFNLERDVFAEMLQLKVQNG